MSLVNLEAERKKGSRIVFVCPMCNYAYDDQKEAIHCCGGVE